MADDKSKDQKNWKYDIYFPHKAGARNDPKLVKVFLKFKHAGLGIYWSLMEILREQPDYRYPADALDELAHSLHVAELKELEEILTLFVKVELLKKERGFYYSNGLNENMKKMKEKSEKARASASARWSKRNANAKPTDNGGNTNAGANAMQVKNSKVNPSKEGLSLLSNSSVSKPAEPTAETLVRGFVSGWPDEVERQAAIERLSKIQPEDFEPMASDIEKLGGDEIREMGLSNWLNDYILE